MNFTGVIAICLLCLELSHASGLVSQLFVILNNTEPSAGVQHTPLAACKVFRPSQCAAKCMATRCCLSIIIKSMTGADGMMYTCYLHDIFYLEKHLRRMPGVKYLHKTPINGENLSSHFMIWDSS